MENKLAGYHQEQITFPQWRRHQGVATIEWRLPDYQQLNRILKSPVYAGAFAHGKSRTQTKVVNGRSRKSSGRHVPLEQWAVLINDHHEGYITWESYMQNQEQLKANSTRAHAVHAWR